MTVVPLGIDLSAFKGETRKQLPARRFGMLFSRDPRKGFEDGYTAFSRAAQRTPGLELHLMGGMPSDRLSKGFIMTGKRFSPVEVPCFLGTLDSWISSSHSEGWGLPSLEAMACGCAVITTEVGGTRYFAVHEETALVTPPGDVASLSDCITQLAEDGSLVGRLSANGLARSARLSFETSLTAIETTLQSCCLRE